MSALPGEDKAQVEAPAPFRYKQEGPFIEAPSGATIIVRTVIWGEAPPGFTPYIGTIMAQVRRVDPNTGQAQKGQVPIQFGIEADDIDQAFERFQECGEAAARKWIAARNKPRIQVASKIPSSNGQFKIGGHRFDCGGGN